jgi:transcriptional regulator
VELCGRARVWSPEVVQDKDWLRRHVADLTEQQEMKSQPKPWAVTDAPESFVEVMLRGIVGFRFAITRLEGKWKMSQNRDIADRGGVIGVWSAEQKATTWKRQIGWPLRTLKR